VTDCPVGHPTGDGDSFTAGAVTPDMPWALTRVSSTAHHKLAGQTHDLAHPTSQATWVATRQF